jgi:hypothetical protein
MPWNVKPGYLHVLNAKGFFRGCQTGFWHSASRLERRGEMPMELPRTYPSFIAGLAYPSPAGLNRARYCAGLKIGTVLELVPDPTNAFDSDAVAIFHGSNHLGFVPRKHGWVAKSLREGDTLLCTIEGIEREIGLDEANSVHLTITVMADGADQPDDRAASMRSTTSAMRRIIKQMLAERRSKK